jgi:LysM repeat protein
VPGCKKFFENEKQGCLRCAEKNGFLFELPNHLGNVLVTLSDRKVPNNTTLGQTITYFKPVVITANDYYPYGMVMPGRTYTTAASGNKPYKYGFNGQERSLEIDANGNSNMAEFWQYDARIGRRWNEDPVTKEWESPYACFSSNPIFYRDINGDDPSGPPETHTVQSGESLSTISAKYGNIPLAKILALNPALKKNPNLIKPGQKIYLPNGSAIVNGEEILHSLAEKIADTKGQISKATTNEETAVLLKTLSHQMREYTTAAFAYVLNRNNTLSLGVNSVAVKDRLLREGLKDIALKAKAVGALMLDFTPLGDIKGVFTGTNFSGEKQTKVDVLIAVVPFMKVKKTVKSANRLRKVFNKIDDVLHDLPVLDHTRKLHGKLPVGREWTKYSREELEQLVLDLSESVKTRLRANQQLGLDPGHAKRIAEEHQLLKDVQKYLSGT